MTAAQSFVVQPIFLKKECQRCPIQYYCVTYVPSAGGGGRFSGGGGRFSGGGGGFSGGGFTSGAMP